MGRERRDQNPQPNKQSAEITATARVFPLVEPEESATISYEDLVTRGCEIVIDPGSVEAIADKMLRQSIFQSRLNGQTKTTFEKSRKTPTKRRGIQIKLARKYQEPQSTILQGEQPVFVLSSRIVDPPPPSHDVGDFGIHELAELALDPVVLDIFAKQQSNSGTLVCPDQLEGGFSIIDLATQNEDTETIGQVDTDDLDLLLEPEEAVKMETSRPANNPDISSNPEEDGLPNEDDYTEDSRP